MYLSYTPFGGNSVGQTETETNRRTEGRNFEYYTEFGKGTCRFLKCFMLTTSEDEVAGTMSYASLTDAVTVPMEHRSAQHGVFIVEIF
jgi:hypothetical protein